MGITAVTYNEVDSYCRRIERYSRPPARPDSIHEAIGLLVSLLLVYTVHTWIACLLLQEIDTPAK